MFPSKNVCKVDFIFLSEFSSMPIIINIGVLFFESCIGDSFQIVEFYV